jgi:hypothetical protein
MVINNVKDLKKYQKLLFSSNREHLIEKAKAFSDIILRWERFGGTSLSDAVLLSDICSEYIKEMAKMYSATGDKVYSTKIAAARELIIKNSWATKKQVLEYLSNNSNSGDNIDFEKAKKMLRDSDLWNKVRPSTLEIVIKENFT